MAERADAQCCKLVTYHCLDMQAQRWRKERNKVEIRARAERALQNMNAAALIRCGLTCDYTSECLGFLRANFDIEDPDVSRIPDVLEEFTKRQRLLFINGYILSDSLQAPGCQVPRPPGVLNRQHRSATQLVYEEIQTPEPQLAFNVAHLLVFVQGVTLKLQSWLSSDLGSSTATGCTTCAQRPAFRRSCPGNKPTSGVDLLRLQEACNVRRGAAHLSHDVGIWGSSHSPVPL